MELTLALRNVFRQKTRTLMTLAAIVSGVAALILAGGFVEDILDQLGEAIIHSQTGHVQIAREGYFDKGASNPERFLIENPQALVKPLEQDARVLAAAARLSFSGLLNNGRTDLPILGEGVEPLKERHIGTYMRIVQGRGLEDDNRDGILIGAGLAQSLNIKPGERVNLVVNAVGGAMNVLDFEVVGVFESFSKDFDARAVRIHWLAAQDLMATSGATLIVLALRETDDTDNVVEHFAARFQKAKIDVRSWYSLSDFYLKSVELYRQQFGVLQFIILIMVVLGVANTVNMSAFERVAEFGTLRAVGSTGRSIFKLLILENFILGAIGALLGALLGYGLAAVISAVGIPMPPPPGSNLGYTAHIQIAFGSVMLSALVGISATMVAALLPAIRVARIPLVDALRRAV